MSGAPNPRPSGANGRASETDPPILLARVHALERVSEDRWSRLDRTLSRLEAAIDRMDRRLWLAASASAAAGASVLGALIWRAAGF